jgi:hypothetical protein
MICLARLKIGIFEANIETFLFCRLDKRLDLILLTHIEALSSDKYLTEVRKRYETTSIMDDRVGISYLVQQHLCRRTI